RARASLARECYARSIAMKIVAAEVFPVRVPKRTPFALAYATRTAARSVLVRLSSDDGHEGWGEAVPVREVTGERYPDVVEALRRVAAERLPGTDPFDREALRLMLRRDLSSLPSARNAVHSALVDLLGRALGRPARVLLGAARDRLPARASLGLGDLAATLAAARAHLGAGIGTLKLKVAGDPAQEAARVRAVRRELGPAVRLSLDANQAFDRAQALAFVHALDGVNVEFLEQPVPADDLGGLAEVARLGAVPIMADEAVRGPETLLPLLALRAVPLINVKLQKCGGPSEAEVMIRMAEAAGVGVMIGCMIETRIGISAGLAVALGLANVKHIDLDGAFDLEDDMVSSGGARIEGGDQLMNDVPGLGLELDAAKLARWRDPDPAMDE
ncbi:MAG: dipeptide epimerase, partial [bacterium]